jgi:hypothetical protein
MDHIFSEICQDHLPMAPWHDTHLKRLPGINPMERADWVIVDSAFQGQMQFADHLLAQSRDKVLMIDPSAHLAAVEMLDCILAVLPNVTGYDVTQNSVWRPDGAVITLDWDQPLLTARLLVQQDLCIMMPIGDEHVLVGGALCFPASWTLSEKFMRPMTAIHEPVVEYGNELSRRVERMFRMMRPTQDMWRANWLIYNDPHLHQPRRADQKRPRERDEQQWMRVERQSLCKLPKTGAIVFGIHTTVVPMARLTPDQHNSLAKAISQREEETSKVHK